MDIENIDELEVEIKDEPQEIEIEVIPTGTEGLSAYEVAVKEGFEGTESEWLESLKGEVGETPDISIGTTQTLPAGSNAIVTKSGTTENPIFSFGIPRGVQGTIGATPDLQIGTVQSGNESSATITGTAEEPILNLVLEKGDKGSTGSAGQDGISPTVTTSKSGKVTTIEIVDVNGTHTATINDGNDGLNGTNGQDGQDGADGIGVPSGGTTGQVLSKASGTDYDTEWVDASSGDLSNYYTKSETDEAIENEKVIFNLDLPSSISTSVTTKQTVNASSLSTDQVEQINRIIEKGFTNAIINIRMWANYQSFIVNYSTQATGSGFIRYQYLNLFTQTIGQKNFIVNFGITIANSELSSIDIQFNQASGYVCRYELENYLPTSKVKTALNTTSGNVYDVTYINTAMASANSVIGNLNDLTTTEKSNLVGAINEVAGSSGGGEVNGVHSKAYSIYSGQTAKTHAYFYVEGYSTQANFISHGTDFLQKAYNDTAQNFDTSVTQNIIQIFGKDNDGVFFLDIKLDTLVANDYCYGKLVNLTSQKNATQVIRFYVTLNNDTYQISSLANYGAEVLMGLQTQNTTSYTPTADYNPATKKYVDDMVGDIETLLGGI